ncbi:MAG: dockerin type I repeat-containing protein [Clostridia bacterium]|nr:dockerin type I repeat-containing protein [Clostridia bacterium]
MKKVTKLFLSVAAIGALAAGLATSAMAMTATYDAGTVTIVAEDGDKVASTEKTLLILNNDATTVTESDIVQIDQSEDIASVPVGELAEGTYYVRVGGDGNIDTAEFTVGGVASTRLLGDANNDDAVDVMDAATTINHYLEVTTLEGDDLKAADVNKDNAADVLDASIMTNFYLEVPQDYIDGVKTID